MEQNIILEKKFEKIKKQISEGKINVFTSDDDELNRKVLEKLDINVLLLNQEKRKDFQKQRNSGFNQVLAKIAKKKNIAIGINLDEIIENRGRKKAEILARIRQNIKLCNKNKLRMKFISPSEKHARDKRDLKALGLVLGMSTSMTKEL
jgi:RNase P/RNase MRP subunit p30